MSAKTKTKTPIVSKKPGKISPKDSMFLRTYCGEAKNKKLVYELSCNMGGQPIIHSKKTGKWFSLSWTDIVNMAVEAGIDLPDDPV